jgi:hypothetical protein
VGCKFAADPARPPDILGQVAALRYWRSIEKPVCHEAFIGIGGESTRRFAGMGGVGDVDAGSARESEKIVIVQNSLPECLRDIYCMDIQYISRRNTA